MGNNTKKTKKPRKRTQYMCGRMLRWIRLQMKFDPRDMRCVLVPPGEPPMSRRTYEDYEAGKRGISAELAARIRELYRKDREFIAATGERVDRYEMERKRGRKNIN